MVTNLYYKSEIVNTENQGKKVVIKIFSETYQDFLTHKFTAFLEKYPKSVENNYKIAAILVDFLNFTQEKIESHKIKSVEYLTIDICREYLIKIKPNITHSEFNFRKKIIEKFIYFLASKHMLKRINKSLIKINLQLNGNIKLNA